MRLQSASRIAGRRRLDGDKPMRSRCHIHHAQNRLELAQINRENRLIAHAISFGRGPPLIFTDQRRDCMGSLLWTGPRRVWYALLVLGVGHARRVARHRTSSVMAQAHMRSTPPNEPTLALGVKRPTTTVILSWSSWQKIVPSSIALLIEHLERRQFIPTVASYLTVQTR